MSFKITITETKEVTKQEAGNYCVVGTKCITSSEHTDLDFDERKKYKRDKDSEMYVIDIYDYPPKREIIKEVTVTVYEQVVEKLDIKAVIGAVNKTPDAFIYDPTTGLGHKLPQQSI